jgi:hypothetical protein
MTYSSTRSACLRAVALALSVGLVLLGSLAPAQSAPPSTDLISSGQSSGQSDLLADSGFVPGPSNPAPPYPPAMIAQPNAKPQLPPVPMPQDRAADSYRIYTVLLPVGELANPGWSRDMWLLSDTTLSLVPPDENCLTQYSDGINMNPHVAIEAPADRRQEFGELLDDFDRRCHERVQLTPESFNLVVPLKLLNQDEQDEFIRTRFDPNSGREGDMLTARYRGAPGLSRFSEVYFNAHHTLAMVYANDWCGGLCAQSYWEVVGLEDGTWKRLNWRTAVIRN